MTLPIPDKLIRKHLQIMLQFNYTLTDDDYVKFNVNSMLYTKFGKKTTVPLKLLVIPCWFIVFISLSHDFVATIVSTLIASILWFIVFKSYITHFYKGTVRKMRKSGRPPYSENGTICFEEDCIHEICATQENKTSYNIVENIYMADDALYIYYSTTAAYTFVRMRNFTDGERHGTCPLARVRSGTA